MQEEMSSSLSDMTWVANCTKCNVVGPYQCERGTFKRHMKTTGPKKSRYCGNFKVNPRMTWNMDMAVVMDDEEENDNVASCHLYDGLFVIYRESLCAAGTAIPYKVGRISDYEYGTPMCCVEVYTLIPSEGVLKCEGSFDFPYITQVVNVLSYTTHSSTSDNRNHGVQVNSSEVAMLQKYLGSSTSGVALLSSSSSSSSSSVVASSGRKSSHVATSNKNSSVSIHPPDTSTSAVVVDITLSSDDDDEEDTGGRELLLHEEDFATVEPVIMDLEAEEVQEEGTVTEQKEGKGWTESFKKVVSSSLEVVANTLASLANSPTSFPVPRTLLANTLPSPSTSDTPLASAGMQSSSGTAAHLVTENVAPSVSSKVQKGVSGTPQTPLNEVTQDTIVPVHRITSISSDVTTTGATSPLSSRSTLSSHPPSTTTSGVTSSTVTSNRSELQLTASTSRDRPPLSQIQLQESSLNVKTLQERNERAEKDLQDLMKDIMQGQSSPVAITTNHNNSTSVDGRECIMCENCSKVFKTKSGKSGHMRSCMRRKHPSMGSGSQKEASVKRTLVEGQDSIVVHHDLLNEQCTEILSITEEEEEMSMETGNKVVLGLESVRTAHVGGDIGGVMLSQGRAKRSTAAVRPQYNPSLSIYCPPDEPMSKKLRRPLSSLSSSSSLASSTTSTASGSMKLTRRAAQTSATSTHILLSGHTQPLSQSSSKLHELEHSGAQSRHSPRAIRGSSSRLTTGSTSSLGEEGPNVIYRLAPGVAQSSLPPLTSAHLQSGDEKDKEYLGVYYSTTAGRFKAKLNTQSKGLVYEVPGLFDTNIEAAVARDELAMRLFGPDFPLGFNFVINPQGRRRFGGHVRDGLVNPVGLLIAKKPKVPAPRKPTRKGNPEVNPDEDVGHNKSNQKSHDLLNLTNNSVQSEDSEWDRLVHHLLQGLKEKENK